MNLGCKCMTKYIAYYTYITKFMDYMKKNKFEKKTS